METNSSLARLMIFERKTKKRLLRGCCNRTFPDRPQSGASYRDRNFEPFSSELTGDMNSGRHEGHRGCASSWEWGARGRVPILRAPVLPPATPAPRLPSRGAVLTGSSLGSRNEGRSWLRSRPTCAVTVRPHLEAFAPRMRGTRVWGRPSVTCVLSLRGHAEASHLGEAADTRGLRDPDEAKVAWDFS